MKATILSEPTMCQACYVILIINFWSWYFYPNFISEKTKKLTIYLISHIDKWPKHESDSDLSLHKAYPLFYYKILFHQLLLKFGLCTPITN